MKVIVSPKAISALMNFYRNAMETHPNLDEETVLNKIDRFERALQQLETFPFRCPLARHKKEWIEKGCRDFVFEDLHAAYVIARDKTGKQYIYIMDACHSLLYHD